MRKERGNVAVAIQYPKTTTGTRKKRKVRQRIKRLPASEKILYLCSIIICVALAVVVVSRYAVVAELNVAIEKQSEAIQQTKEVNLQLESDIKELSSIERIREFAKEHGLKLIPSIRP